MVERVREQQQVEEMEAALDAMELALDVYVEDVNSFPVFDGEFRSQIEQSREEVHTLSVRLRSIRYRIAQYRERGVI